MKQVACDQIMRFRLQDASAKGTIKRMLIPQFSLRWIMALTAACAVFSLVLAAALRGTAWAIALAVGVGSLAVTLALHGAVFFGVWLFSLLVPVRPVAASRSAESPFAATSFGTSPTRLAGSNDGKPNE